MFRRTVRHSACRYIFREHYPTVFEPGKFLAWRTHPHVKYRGIATTSLAKEGRRRGKNVERISLDDLNTQVAPLTPFVDDVAGAARPKKTRIKKKENVEISKEALKDSLLPQGLLSPGDEQDGEEVAPENSTIAYPTVVLQARNNMLKFNGCVVLTRVGNFYELYFEQAEEYASLLNIKLASKKTNAGQVSMAGFPFFQLDRYLKILVQDLGKHVAISEEIANDPSQKVKSGGLLFDRQVKRVVTPGTLIDENFLRPYEPNYLLAIHVPRNELSDNELSPVGLSWLDLSSGDFFVQTTDIRSLSSSIARIGPREIILDQALRASPDKCVTEALKHESYDISYHEVMEQSITSHAWSESLDGGALLTAPEVLIPEEGTAANLLIGYIQTQLPGFPMRFQAPIRREMGDYMTIDKNSLRSLEIAETLRDGLFKGSLLQAIRRTSTASGARLLTQRLTFPSMSLSVINDRLDLVDDFIANDILHEEVVDLLKCTFDTLRLLQKFSFGRGDADDLSRLAQTIKLTAEVGNLLKRAARDTSSSLYRIWGRLDTAMPATVANRIVEAIDEESLVMRQRSEEAATAEAVGQARQVLGQEEMDLPELSDLKKTLATKRVKNITEKEDTIASDEIWIMRRNATPILERLHDRLVDFMNEKDGLEISLREQTNAESLSLKFTPGLGHICHIRGKDTKLNIEALENIRTVGATKSTRSFYLPQWTKLGHNIEDAKIRIRKEEQIVFQSLRELVITHLVLLRKNAAVLDELDVACSSATLAIEHGLKRPQLNNGCNHVIYGGRHIVVEMGLAESGRQFMPNDCVLNDSERTWLITGPNMAGKSTFLRQTALTSILAQTGSFVPAEYVEIGMVDQIFSRVGSADNLSQDQSTFMVEMLETAHILRNATPRSFVIMDEVGRGTTPQDGLAVGYAVLHHLQYVNKCRTLFATHFHELADMTKDFSGLACYCTNVVDEPGESFRYDHRLRKGVNRDSHALKVAKLAGMPLAVIDKAAEVLKDMEATQKASQDGY